MIFYTKTTIWKYIIYSIVIGFAWYASAAVPSILIAPIQYDSLEEMLYIEGKSEPNATIDLLFETTSGAQPVRVETRANANGEWFFADRLELADGEWMLRARAIASPASEWSVPRLIQVKHSGFYIGSLKIRYLPTIAGILVAIMGSCALFIYAFRKVRAVKHFVAHQKAQLTISQEFADLRQRISEELAFLEERSKRGALTEEEKSHKGHLLQELRKAEESIEKQIKEIS